MSEWVTAVDGGVRLSLHVAPRASRSAVVGEHGGRLKVQVAAPPVDGAANAEIIRLFARVLGVSRGDVSIRTGQSGRRKVVEVAGVSADVVEAALCGAEVAS